MTRRIPRRAATRGRALRAALFALPLSLATVVAEAHDTCLVGATVHPVSSPAGAYTVCMEAGRISSVLPATDPTPEADHIIEIAGHVVTPGLVEVATTLGLQEVSLEDSTVDIDAGEADDVRAAFDVADSLNPQTALLPVARTGGITSVVSVPGGGLISGLGRWWDLVEGPARDVLVEGGSALYFALGNAGGDVEGGARGDATLRIREIFADTRMWVSDPAGFDRAQMRDLSVSLLDMQALTPALSGATPVVFSAQRLSDIRAAIALSQEWGLRPVISGGADAWLMADELAAAGVPVILDPTSNLPNDFESLHACEEAAGILARAGVPVILTTWEAHNIRTLRQSAGNAVRAGMEWETALEAITRTPALAFGVGDRYGTIEVGKVANLSVFDGDPFETRTVVRQVFVRGDEVSMRTRQTELLERWRSVPERAPVTGPDARDGAPSLDAPLPISDPDAGE